MMNPMGSVCPPKFNVCDAFDGVTVIQCNAEFADLMVQLLSEIDDLEPEILAFRSALKDPEQSRALRQQRTPRRRRYPTV